MSNEHIEDLLRMRDLLVEDRRTKVKLMLTARSGSVGSQFHDNLVRLQAAIAAANEALADERALLRAPVSD
jgi:hypothetical protein